MKTHKVISILIIIMTGCSNFTENQYQHLKRNQSTMIIRADSMTSELSCIIQQTDSMIVQTNDMITQVDDMLIVSKEINRLIKFNDSLTRTIIDSLHAELQGYKYYTEALVNGVKSLNYYVAKYWQNDSIFAEVLESIIDGVNRSDSVNKFIIARHELNSTGRDSVLLKAIREQPMVNCLKNFIVTDSTNCTEVMELLEDFINNNLNK